MKHTKDHNKWNEKQKELDKKTTKKYINEREIWWCHIGTNIGTEMDGKGEMSLRPGLVLRKISADTLWVIPLTKKVEGLVEEKGLEKFFYKLGEIEEDGIIYDDLLALGQIRTLDRKRLFRKHKQLPKKTFNAVIERLIEILKNTKTSQ